MEKNKSQRYNFAYESIPVLFHTQTGEFLKYIERDGAKFLLFWWDQMGDRLPETQRQPFEGFELETRDLKPATHIILLTFPTPALEGEVYFMALISVPEKRFAWVKMPNTRIIALAKREDGVELGYLTPRSNFVPIPEDVEPNRQAFTDAVLRIVQGS